jgi:hypothetical protein
MRELRNGEYHESLYTIPWHLRKSFSNPQTRMPRGKYIRYLMKVHKYTRCEAEAEAFKEGYRLPGEMNNG